MNIAKKKVIFWKSIRAVMNSSRLGGGEEKDINIAQKTGAIINILINEYC